MFSEMSLYKLQFVYVICVEIGKYDKYIAQVKFTEAENSYH